MTCDAGRLAEFRLSAAQIRMLDARLMQLREEFFPQEYFTRHPWRLLLDIEHAMETGAPFPGDRWGVLPPTTALRYLAMFEKDGLVERRPDPKVDGRDLVVLTPKGSAALTAVFEQAALGFNEFG